MNKVPLFVPPGHFYSPIVVPAEVEELVSAARISPPETLPDVSLNLARMESLWKDLLPTLRTTSFPHDPHPGRRYHWKNGHFGYGDAMMLRAMIMRQKPRRFIEIGSGFSSAVVLDTLDEMGGPRTALTFIDPYPETLRLLLQPGDAACVQLIEQRVRTYRFRSSTTWTYPTSYSSTRRTSSKPEAMWFTNSATSCPGFALASSSISTTCFIRSSIPTAGGAR